MIDFGEGNFFTNGTLASDARAATATRNESLIGGPV